MAAIGVAVLTHQVVTSIWYSYNMFGRVWMRLLDKLTPQQAEKIKPSYDVPQAAAYGSLLHGIVLSVAMYTIFSWIGVNSYLSAVGVALTIWAISASATFSQHLAEERTLTLWLIDTGHQLALILSVSLVLILLS